MKKFVIALVLVLSFGLAVPQTDALVSKYRDFWAQLFGDKFDNQNPAKKSVLSYSKNLTKRRYTRRTNLRSRFSRLSRRRSKFSRDFTRRTSLLSRLRTDNSAGLVATISKVGPNQHIQEVDETPIPVFKLGIRNNKKTLNNRLPKAVLLDEAKFQLISRNGIFKNPRNFTLVIDGEDFRFDENGQVTVRFNNARLAEGESLDLDIAIKADDPDNMFHQNGSAKLQLLELTAEEEFSREKIPVVVQGSRISKLISYLPTPRVSSGGTSHVSVVANSSIYGDIILPGEEKFVLAVEMNAIYDDIAIRKMKVRNVLTGNLIDSQIEEIQAVNLLTGEVLDTSRFVNGEARFQFSPRVNITRNDYGKIGFKVKVRENPRNSGDRRFQLTVFPSDVLAESLSTGREIPDSNKRFNVDGKTFVVMKTKLDFLIASVQPDNFLINTGDPDTVFEFEVKNSRSSAELARVSFNVYPSGLQFHGGSISDDDFELVEVIGNHEEHLNQNISIVGGNTVVVDFAQPLNFWRNSAKKFRLKAALDDDGVISDSDGVSVRLLSDGNYINGTLSAVRASGANIVWSDESGHYHSTTSDDWFSGYELDVPSNSIFIEQ